MNTVGSQFQRGFPDKYCFHPKYRQRWVEVKNPGNNYDLTKAQLAFFPKMHEARIGIWILTGASQEEYDKLHQLPNWKDYLKPRHKKWIREHYPELEGYEDD